MPSTVGMTRGNELAGKVALVTGGARNIGRAIARSLAAGGAAVMVNARTSRAQAEETVALIAEAGGKAALHIADVTDPAQVRALVAATLQRFGRLDMLVNNAAVRAETPFESMVPQSALKLALQEIFQVTVTGAEFTDAANVSCPPEGKVTKVGDTVTYCALAVAFGVNVTDAVADFVVSACDVAVIVSVTVVVTVAGAV